MSISSKQGGGSRASDEDGKTSVKVGTCKMTAEFGAGGGTVNIELTLHQQLFEYVRRSNPQIQALN